MLTNCIFLASQNRFTWKSCINSSSLIQIYSRVNEASKFVMLIQEFYFKSLICMIFLSSYHLASLSFPLSAHFLLAVIVKFPNFARPSPKMSFPYFPGHPSFSPTFPSFLKSLPTRGTHICSNFFRLLVCLWVAQSRSSIIHIYLHPLAAEATTLLWGTTPQGINSSHRPVAVSSTTNIQKEKKTFLSKWFLLLCCTIICQRKTVNITNLASVLLIWTLKIKKNSNRLSKHEFLHFKTTEGTSGCFFLFVDMACFIYAEPSISK